MQKFNERKDSKKQLYWKKRLWYSCFLMNLARYLRQLFYRTPPGNCFCSTEKYFTNKIVESLLKKRKNIGNYWQVKQRHTQKKNVSLLVSSLHILSLFKNFLIPFLCFSWYIESTCFYKQCNHIEDLSTTENYFSPSIIWLWLQ